MSILKRDPNRINEEKWNATHTNSNRYAGIAIKTTGLNPKIHEIAQICVFPLTSTLTLAKETIPFYTDIRPTKPEVNLQLGKGFLPRDKYLDIKYNAPYPQEVAELFDRWMVEKIKLSFGKKLLPLTHNWAAMRPFLKNWLGPINFNSYFSHEYRDIQSLALFCNDYADIHAQQLPYPKVHLSFITNILHVEYHRYDETILQVKAMTEVYREMIRKIIPVVQ